MRAAELVLGRPITNGNILTVREELLALPSGCPADDPCSSSDASDDPTAAVRSRLDEAAPGLSKI
jgi:hypothetical protein